MKYVRPLRERVQPEPTREHLTKDAPIRDNPLNAPPLLLEAADSSITDMIEVVLHEIDQLPAPFRASLDRHMDTGCIDDLRIVFSALSKLRRNEMPSDDEIGNIAHPHYALEQLAEGFGDAARREQISVDLELKIQEQIVEPLATVANTYLPRGTAVVVDLWTLDLRSSNG